MKSEKALFLIRSTALSLIFMMALIVSGGAYAASQIPNPIKYSIAEINESLKAVTYGELKTRLLIKTNANLSLGVTPRPEYLQAFDGAYSPILYFTESSDRRDIAAGTFLRILHIYSVADYSATFSKNQIQAVETNGYSTYYIFASILDQNLKPIGEPFQLATKAKASETVVDILQYSEDFLSQMPTLEYKRANVGDILTNTRSLKYKGRLVPPYTQAQVKSIQTSRISFTLNYNYKLILKLLQCPPEWIKASISCDIVIKGTASDTSPNWAHYVLPENARVTKFLGFEVHY